MLENFVFPKTEAEVDLIFQQHGATAHFCANVPLLWTNDFLVDGSEGEGRLIGPHGLLKYQPWNFSSSAGTPKTSCTAKG
jgi:hypothetical protein